MTEAAYTAKDITVLEGLEPVRLRPGMYIGSTGSRGLHHLVYEVVDNSVDEALAGRADLVEVILHPDNSVTVTAMKAVGPTKETGTKISFLPDLEIFDELEWSRETLVQRLRETAFLTRGLRIVLIDEREGETRDEFHYEGGIRDFVAYVNQSKDPLHKHIV